MRENKGLILNVGTPSVLVILVVFVLSVFSILSVGASANEVKLAEKTATSVKEYYEADQKAEYSLLYISNIIKESDLATLEENIVGLEAGKEEAIKGMENVNVKLDENAIFSSGEKKKIGTISYEFFVRNDSYLNVELSLFSDRSFDISKWNMTQTYAGTYELDDTVELWDGNVTFDE